MMWHVLTAMFAMLFSAIIFSLGWTGAHDKSDTGRDYMGVAIALLLLGFMCCIVSVMSLVTVFTGEG